MRAILRTALLVFTIFVTQSSCSSSGGDIAQTSSGGPVAGGASGTGMGGTVGLGGVSQAGGSGGGGNPAQGGIAGAVSSGTGGMSASTNGGAGSAGEGGGSTGGSGTSGTSGAAGEAGAPSAGGAAACHFVPLPCTAEQHDAQVAIMNLQPILPPRFLGGLDLTGGPSGTGVTLSQIAEGYYRDTYQTGEQVYPGACVQVCTTGASENAPQWSGILLSGVQGDSLAGDSFYLDLPYSGSLTMMSRPGGPWGSHTYAVTIGQQMQRDDLPMNVAFDAASVADPMGWPNEIYDAFVATFSPSAMPLSPSQSCVQTKDCKAGISDGFGAFGAASLQFYWLFGDPAQGPTAATTVSEFQFVNGMP